MYSSFRTLSYLFMAGKVIWRYSTLLLPFSWADKVIKYLGIFVTESLAITYTANFPPFLKKSKADIKRLSTLPFFVAGWPDLIKMVVLLQTLWNFQLFPILLREKSIHESLECYFLFPLFQNIIGPTFSKFYIRNLTQKYPTLGLYESHGPFFLPFINYHIWVYIFYGFAYYCHVFLRWVGWMSEQVVGNLRFILFKSYSHFHLIVVFSLSDYVLCPFSLPLPSFVCSSCMQINWILCVIKYSHSTAST